MITLMIQPIVYVLLGMIVLPIVVFKIISLSNDGFFDKFKRKK